MEKKKNMTQTNTTQTSEQIAMQVSGVSIAVNVFLSLIKFIAGLIGHSGAMISDAVHSASDVLSTVVVIVGVKISGKAADEEHEYGHERLECIASIILAVMLALTGLGIGAEGINKITDGNYGELAVPGTIALVAAVASIVIKEAMYWYTKIAADKINSTALMADAWHHRSDALSSIGSFIGIFAARLGYPIMDPVASVVICLFILKAAYEIFRDAIGKVIDEACDEETEQQLKELVIKQPGVQRLDELKTRKFGSKVYVDVEVSANGNLTLCEGHEIAKLIHNQVEAEFPLVKHCMVHMNPLECDSQACKECKNKKCKDDETLKKNL